MENIRVGAVMVVQNDAETVEQSLASFYDHIEYLVVSTDPRRGWSGKAITPDDTIARIRAFDKNNKIEIIEQDFYRYPDPIQNETAQRQTTVDHLVARRPDIDWVVQIDADEVFQDYAACCQALSEQPSGARGVFWRMMVLFNRLDDGRYLVIVNQDGEPIMERLALAHRPQCALAKCREPVLPLVGGKPDPTAMYQPPPDMEFGKSLLHYSYAKSEERVWGKLQTWGHAHEVNADAYFALWKQSQTDWQNIRDFHPTYPIAWPALKPFTLDELRALGSCRPVRHNIAQRVVRRLRRTLANQFGRASAANSPRTNVTGQGGRT